MSELNRQQAIDYALKNRILLNPDELNTCRSHDKLHLLCPSHGVYEQELRRVWRVCRYCQIREAQMSLNRSKHIQYGYSQEFINALAYVEDQWLAEDNELLTSDSVTFVCPKHGHYTRYVSDRYNKTTQVFKGCPFCGEERRHKTYSQKELDSFAYCQSLYNGDIIHNFRGLVKLNGRWMELDIYLPELGIAFEIDGGPYHTENCTYDEYYSLPWRERNLKCWYGYHAYKDSEFLKKGVRIIHIGDYDYYKKVIKTTLEELKCIS